MGTLSKINVGSTTYDIRDNSAAASISILDHTITLKNKDDESIGSVTVPDNDSGAGAMTVIDKSINEVSSWNAGTLSSLSVEAVDETYDRLIFNAGTSPTLTTSTITASYVIRNATSGPEE